LAKPMRGIRAQGYEEKQIESWVMIRNGDAVEDATKSHQ